MVEVLNATWLRDNATVYGLGDDGTNLFSFTVQPGFASGRRTPLAELVSVAEMAAAAPAMYAALQAIAAAKFNCSHQQMWMAMQAVAEAAIAQATGAA